MIPSIPKVLGPEPWITRTYPKAVLSRFKHHLWGRSYLPSRRRKAEKWEQVQPCSELSKRDSQGLESGIFSLPNSMGRGKQKRSKRGVLYATLTNFPEQIALSGDFSFPICTMALRCLLIHLFTSCCSHEQSPKWSILTPPQTIYSLLIKNEWNMQQSTKSKKKGGGRGSQIFYIFHNLAYVIRRNLHLLIHHYSALQIIKSVSWL